MSLNELLNNQWFVSIVGGVASAWLYTNVGPIRRNLKYSWAYRRRLAQANSAFSKQLHSRLQELQASPPELIDTIAENVAEENDVGSFDLTIAVRDAETFRKAFQTPTDLQGHRVELLHWVRKERSVLQKLYSAFMLVGPILLLAFWVCFIGVMVRAGTLRTSDVMRLLLVFALAFVLSLFIGRKR